MGTRARGSSALAFFVVLGSCTGGEPPGAIDWTMGRVIAVDVPSTMLEDGGETLDLCYALTLHNDVPIYVSQVAMHGTTGVHHSNWFYVPDFYFDGDDGLFSCAERHFDPSGAATHGGVLFAQSTQATDETMSFPAGDALMVPANARFVVNLHYVNYSGGPLTPEISLRVRTVSESDVTTRLHGFAFQYDDLHIAPRTSSEFTVDCDLDATSRRSLGHPLDFGIHYVLPHYHSFGTYLRLGIVGGPHDGATIWEADSRIGEPLGSPISPPADLTGATGIRLTCRYDNPGDTEILWGNGGGEMCIAFGYSDSPNLWANVGGSGTITGTSGGVTRATASCTVITARPPL